MEKTIREESFALEESKIEDIEARIETLEDFLKEQMELNKDFQYGCDVNIVKNKLNMSDSRFDNMHGQLEAKT